MTEKVMVRFLRDDKEIKKGEEILMDKDGAEMYLKEGNGLIEIIARQRSEPKEILKQELAEQEIENFKEGEINWLEGSFWDSWDKVKGHSKKLWRHKCELLEDDEDWKKFFLAHSNDTIIGKPQLIETVQKRIPLVKQAIKKIDKDEDGNTFEEAVEIQSFFFLDETFDKRYNGYLKDSFALDFWMYRIITSEKKEYYVLAQKELPNEVCELRGMEVLFDDFAEITRSMKLTSLSRVFFMKSFEPNVKVLSKEQIIKFTKERNITEEDWFLCLAEHPFGTLNRFPTESELLKSAQILSGKMDGYPLHIVVMGNAGTRKSCGYLETTAYKFSEEPEIFEGGNSRLKGLIPSFKDRPANLGYLARANRMGFIDELGKLVMFELNKHQTSTGDVLGEVNMLLDNKSREVGSGNAEASVKAGAKFLWVMNPIANCPTIYNHVGSMDRTFMSRCLWWVQDLEEQKFVLSEKGIVRISPYTSASIYDIEKRKKEIVLKKCWGKSMVREEFLTLFDSCNNFLSEIDFSEVLELAKTTTLLIKEPMKSVWKPRAEHHITLLIDGICKTRCLFKDYDPTFTAKQEDYDNAEKILTRMRLAWDTDLSVRQEYQGGGY